jgi:hypothetical protein
MATDDSGLTDDVVAELNPGGEDATLPPLPARPAEGAPKGKWLDYVVALGGGRDALTGQTEHFDPASGGPVQGTALGRDELVALAERLGG